jgi:hypothetical protein
VPSRSCRALGWARGSDGFGSSMVRKGQPDLFRVPWAYLRYAPIIGGDMKLSGDDWASSHTYTDRAVVRVMPNFELRPVVPDSRHVRLQTADLAVAHAVVDEREEIGNVNPDWPHRAQVIWPHHLLSVVGG